MYESREQIGIEDVYIKNKLKNNHVLIYIHTSFTEHTAWMSKP
jgi:hypothetical protein